MSHMFNSSCPRELWQAPSYQLKRRKIGLFWLWNDLKWEVCNFCTTSSIKRNCSLFVLAITGTVAWFGTACLSDNGKRGLIWSHYFCNFCLIAHKLHTAPFISLLKTCDRHDLSVKFILNLKVWFFFYSLKVNLYIFPLRRDVETGPFVSWIIHPARYMVCV